MLCHCVMRGIIVSYFRYKENTRISPSDKYVISQDGNKYSLTINTADENDSGAYRIVAGPHSSSAQLTVKLGKLMLPD